MIEAFTVLHAIIYILMVLFITKVTELFTRRKQRKLFFSDSKFCTGGEQQPIYIRQFQYLTGIQGN